jgi:hypothetical protein
MTTTRPGSVPYSDESKTGWINQFCGEYKVVDGRSMKVKGHFVKGCGAIVYPENESVEL